MSLAPESTGLGRYEPRSLRSAAWGLASLYPLAEIQGEYPFGIEYQTPLPSGRKSQGMNTLRDTRRAIHAARETSISIVHAAVISNILHRVVSTC